MQDNFVNLGIVMLPPQDTWEWLVSLSTKLNSTSGNPSVQLGDVQNPHMSLIHSHVEDSKLTELYDKLNAILTRFHPLELNMEELFNHQHRDIQFIGVGVSRTAELQELHVAVSDAILPFEGKERSSRKRAYDNFFPHFTLAVNLGEFSRDIAEHTFTANSVVACRLGRQFSTCDEVLCEWQLRRQ